jgi:hypothetical protein
MSLDAMRFAASAKFLPQSFILTYAGESHVVTPYTPPKDLSFE